MSLLVPRLDRVSATILLNDRRGLPVEQVSALLPDRDVRVTLSELGGQRATEHELEEVRAEVLAVARENGFPTASSGAMTVDGPMARVLHQRLPMTPNEAAREEVWSYITCCWLLDVALWRWGADAPERRFLGDVNRNAFRRLWWRAEVLGGGVPLERMREDELVSIMERPTIAGDRRLARSIALEFLRRAESDGAAGRMLLMRDAVKRLLRLTPFVSFEVLTDEDLMFSVGAAFDDAVAALAGRELPSHTWTSRRPPTPSPNVTQIPSARAGQRAFDHDGVPVDAADLKDPELAAEVALGLARNTGRVTNITLRQVMTLDSAGARRVLQSLVDSGRLARRGVRRGTYYVIPEDAQDGSTSVLRRLLRRGRV
jgi:hypothetical protein